MAQQSLDDARIRFHKLKGHADSTYQDQKATIRVRYFLLLDNFTSFAQQLNEQEAVRWAKNEKIRYDQYAAISVSTNPDHPEDLKRVQADLKQANASARLRWQQQIIEYTYEYIRRLETLYEVNIKANRNAEALAVRTEITTVLNDDTLRIAETHVKAMQSGEPNELRRIENSQGSTLLYDDAFSDKTLGEEWMASTERVTQSKGRLVTYQGTTYLNLARRFDGNFRVEMDVENLGTENDEGSDYAIVLKSPKAEAAIRFNQDVLNSFTLNQDSMALGGAERLLHPGTLSLIHKNGKIRAEYRDQSGQTLATSWQTIAPFEQTFIQFRLTANGSKSARCLNHVRVIRLQD